MTMMMMMMIIIIIIIIIFFSRTSQSRQSLHYKDKPLKLLAEIISAYCEHHTKRVSIFGR